MSDEAAWKEFENQVAELYRLMGYEVKQNVGLLGHEIDLLLMRTMLGGIKTKTAVECKYVEKGNLRKNDAMENILALTDLRINNKVQHLVIITTNGFSKDLWYTAEENNIQLFTFQELQHQIANFEPYLDRLIKNFEEDEVSKYYVDLVAQDNKETIFNPIDKYISNWLENVQINHVSILGEYGTGKTSFCRKLAYDLARKYKKDPLNTRIPLLVNLKDYSEIHVSNLIMGVLSDKCGLQGMNYPLFEKMNAEGLFVLIFDGFDELTQKVIFDVAYANFFKIAELSKSEKSKVLLTCRTEFFRTYEREKEVLLDIAQRENFDIIYLKEFNDEQIREFLKKRVPLIKAHKKKKHSWQYYHQQIELMSDWGVGDLAKRPVLLNLIIKCLPQLIKEKEKINASALYRITIQEELQRKLTVGKSIIHKEDRIKLMKLLAARMYTHNRLDIYYKDIPKLLDHFDLNTRTDIEYHLHDFLTCSFLNRDSQGNYYFSHKSFIDFLVAWKFVEDIEKDYKEDFLQVKITYEVEQFIKNFEIQKNTLYNWIELTKRKSFSETKYLGGNAVTILNAAGEKFAKKKVDFSETVLDYANFGNQDLTGLNFQNASLRNVNFNPTVLTNTDFSFADLKDANFPTIAPAAVSVFWNPNGKYIAAINQWDSLVIWEAETLKKIKEVEGVSGFCWSPDGNLFLATDRREIQIWNSETYELKGEIKCKDQVVYFITDDNFEYVISNEYRTVRVYNLLNKKLLKEFGPPITSFEPRLKLGKLNQIALTESFVESELILWDFIKNTTKRKEFDHRPKVAYFGKDFLIIESTKLGAGYSFNYVSPNSIHPKIKEQVEIIFVSTDDFQILKKINFETSIYFPHSQSSYSDKFGLFCLAGYDNCMLFGPDLDQEPLVLTQKAFASDFRPDGKQLVTSNYECVVGNNRTNIEENKIQIWDTDPRSETFGKCINEIILHRSGVVDGMNIKGVKGRREADIRVLKNAGAVEN